MDNLWGIVLAAGASTRMKTQKMLLPYNGKTVLETVITNASFTLNKNLMVVTGSHREEIIPLVEKLEVNYCINSEYMQGMLSSVICGFNSLPESAKAALILLGDQPQISPDVIQKLKKAWLKSDKGIVIPVWEEKRGHPVLIETKFRNEINRLHPELGLKNLMNNHTDEILEVDCGSPGILRDMDTIEDYKNEINLIN